MNGLPHYSTAETAPGDLMSLPALLLFLACAETPVLQGRVIDIWGDPIEGAQVMMVGQGERPMTNVDGRYQMAIIPGTHQFKAGREGYIQDQVEYVVPGGGTEGPTFRLYKKPSEPGLYVVSTGGYDQLKPVPVEQVGTPGIAAFRGVRTSGEAETQGSRIKVLFHSDLKLDEVMRLGLELHRLDYKAKTDIKGDVMGRAEVDLNLWVSAGKVPVEIKPMRSRTDYLIVSTQPIEPGVFAFQSAALLDPEQPEVYNQMPAELRTVYPFEVR